MLLLWVVCLVDWFVLISISETILVSSRFLMMMKIIRILMEINKDDNYSSSLKWRFWTISYNIVSTNSDWWNTILFFSKIPKKAYWNFSSWNIDHQRWKRKVLLFIQNLRSNYSDKIVKEHMGRTWVVSLLISVLYSTILLNVWTNFSILNVKLVRFFWNCLIC